MTLTRTLSLLFACIAFCASSALAQPDRNAEIDAARQELTQIRSVIESGEVEDPSEMSDTLRRIREESRQRLAEVERELESVRSQLNPLGPPPGENDPPEGEELAAQRAALNEELGRLNGQKTRINANIFECGDLLTRISARRVQLLYQSLLSRGPSPVMPDVIGPASASISEVWGKIDAYFRNWGSNKEKEKGLFPAISFIAGALAISLLLFGPVNRWITATFSQAIEKRKPTPARRVVAAGLKMVARTAPGLIGGLIILITLNLQGVITEQGEEAAKALWFGLVAYLLVSGFTNGLFAPANPSWRIAPVDASRGKAASRLLLAIVIIFGLKNLLVEIFQAAGAAEELIRLVTASGAIIVGGLLFLLCRTRLWRNALAPFAEGESQEKKEPTKVANGFWRFVRRLGRAIAIVTIVAALIGYTGLANFIASRFYYLALFLAVAWFVRALLKESMLWLRSRLQVKEEGEDEEDIERSTENFRFWTNWIINFALLVALMPALLVLFGMPASNVRDLAYQSLFGFNVGNLHIPSIANILAAIIVFIAILALTKLIQRAFQKGPFAHSHIDSGVQNSLITLMGYAGLLIALFAAVSAIGFDLGNLALIAGALSVGIGFGLQSIVNNFVSGLILLFERPIKVGDWIITASGEGTVKKISVRSTEIETFDRASIIIPNSELVSSTVTNWTHRNKIGRIIVPVGVSYNSDPEKVKEILLRCAHEHPKVVSYPEPFVTWMDFGASSLDFQIRAYLADISDGLNTRTDLRFAIFKALKEEGIEIPFPQRDLHVKSWPDEFKMKSNNNGEHDA